MRNSLRLIVLLLCLLWAGAGLADDNPLAPENLGECFHLEDGVIYWVDQEEAVVVDFLTDAEHITIRPEILGKPVRCERIRWSDGLAQSITVKKGVMGLEYLYISGFRSLETVEIRAAVDFATEEHWDGSDVYLLDCPVLTSFRVYENSEDGTISCSRRSCPNLVLHLPLPEEIELPGASYDTPRLFTEEDFPGETTYIIPEGTVYAQICSTEVLRLELPSTLERISLDTPNLQEMLVAQDNPSMISHNGVLYSEDYAYLYAYPSGRKDAAYTVHPDTKWVYQFSSQYLETITLSNAPSFTDDFGFHCPNLSELIYPKTYAIPEKDADYVARGYLDYDTWDAHFRPYSKTSLWGTSEKSLRISMEEGNENLILMEGLFYSMDGKTLLRVPPSIRGTLVIPEGTVRIAPLAMEECSDIETLVLPASLETLSALDILGLVGLKAFSVAPENPNYQTLDGVLFSKDGATLLLRPPMHGTSYTLPSGTKHIAPLAFLANNMLEEVRMPMGVETIGERAFQGNRALVTLNLSPSITEIGDYAFEDCYKLERLVLPKGLTWVGHMVGFSELQELDWYDHDNPQRMEDVTPIEIWIPGTIQRIDPRAFTYSSGFSGRTTDELLLVVEEGSEGHFMARNESIPYCFPDQVGLAREGFRYVLLVGEADQRVQTYGSPSLDDPGPSYPEGTALLWLGEQDGFCIAQIGQDRVYVQADACRIVPEERGPWPFTDTELLRRDAFLYAQPTTDSPVGSLPADTRINIVTILGPWCSVYTEQGSGYMLRKDFYEHWVYNIHEQTSAISGQVPVYGAPDEGAKVIRWLDNGQEISMKQATKDGWAFIGTGYIKIQMKALANTLPSQERRKAIHRLFNGTGVAVEQAIQHGWAIFSPAYIKIQEKISHNPLLPQVRR